MPGAAADRGGVIAFTDGLVRAVFQSLELGARACAIWDCWHSICCRPAKSALSRLSTGGGGRVPKLARGVALT